MKNIFTSKENARLLPNNKVVKSHSSVTYWDKSLMTLGSKIWNALPKKSNLKKIKKIKYIYIYLYILLCSLVFSYT